MRPPRFAESSHQDVVGRLQEQDVYPVAALLKLFKDPGVIAEEFALARVDSQGDSVDRLEGPLAQLEEALDENDRQVVDAIVPEVLEHVNCRTLAGPRKAADNDDLELQAHTDSSLQAIVPLTGAAPSQLLVLFSDQLIELVATVCAEKAFAKRLVFQKPRHASQGLQMLTHRILGRHEQEE